MKFQLGDKIKVVGFSDEEKEHYLEYPTEGIIKGYHIPYYPDLSLVHYIIRRTLPLWDYEITVTNLPENNLELIEKGE